MYKNVVFVSNFETPHVESRYPLAFDPGPSSVAAFTFAKKREVKAKLEKQ